MNTMPRPGTALSERPDLDTVASALLRLGSVAFGGLGATLTGAVFIRVWLNA